MAKSINYLDYSRLLEIYRVCIEESNYCFLLFVTIKITIYQPQPNRVAIK